VVAEPVVESQDVVMGNHEMKMETPSVNIEIHPDPVFLVTATDLGSYARVIAGIVGSLALLSPLILLPSLIVLVLPAEIYAVGWVYDRVMELRTSGTKTSTDGSSVGTVSLETAKTKSTASTLRYINSHIEGLE
jgi:hypothetical protein